MIVFILIMALLIARRGNLMSPIVLISFPLLMTTILVFNLSGVLPYCQAPTSSPLLVFALALITMIAINVRVMNWDYLLRFMPVKEILMTLILMPLEIVAYLNRIISLALRLLINISAGKFMVHTVMDITQGGLLVLTMLSLLLAFELMIAYLQSFIFTYIIRLG